MFEIINETFTVGDQFIGAINGAKFKVVGVGKGTNSNYKTTEGMDMSSPEPWVLFIDTEKGGDAIGTNLKTAQRLLLKDNNHYCKS